MMNGKNRLAQMSNVGEDCRNMDAYSNEYLEQV